MMKDKTKAFITGGTGQVGTELIRRADAWQIDIVAPKRADMNIINKTQVNSQLDYLRPDIVINSAAFTAVDAAENDKDAKSMYLTAKWASSNLLLGDNGDITTIKPSDVPAVHMLTG